MLNPFVSSAVYALEMLIYYIFFYRVVPRKAAQWKCFLIGTVIFEACSALNLVFHNNLVVNTISSVAAMLAFSTLCFEIRYSIALALGFFFNGLNFAIESVVVIGFAGLWKVNVLIYNSDLSALIIVVVLSKSLLFLISLILSQFLHGNKINVRMPLCFLFYSMFTVICLLLIWSIVSLGPCTDRVKLYLCCISVILFMSVILLFITYLYQLEKENRFIQMRRENERLEMEREYYRILEEQNQKLMIYTHDTKKHLQALGALSEYSKIQEYIGKLLEELNVFSRNCHSGNKLLDVMIDKYMIVCQKQGIDFSFDIRNCNLSALDDMDLVAILGNLMDNAIQAAQNAKHKTISLQTVLRNGFQILVLTNSCDTPPIQSGHTLSTSKKDRSLHGFGLKSVENSLKKYDGAYDWQYDEVQKTFMVTAMVGEKNSS